MVASLDRTRGAWFGVAFVLLLPVASASAQQPGANAGLSALALPDGAAAELDRARVLASPVAEAIDAAGLRQQVGALLAAARGAQPSLAAVALSCEGEIDRAFRYVRDQVRTVAYPGALRGVDGTLRAREGNPTDKALLLSALLAANGYETRFAFGELPAAAVDALFAQQFVAGAPAAPVADWVDAAFVGELQQRARRDHAAIRTGFAEDLARTAQLAVATSAALRATLQSHVFVQVQDGSGWRDLDPSFADTEPGQRRTEVQRTAPALAADAFQRLTVRLLVETMAGEALSTATALEVSHDVIDLADRDVFVVHWPAGAAGGVASLFGGTAAGGWVPVVQVGADVKTGAAIAFDPPTSRASFDGLSGGLTGESAPVPTFTGEWVEFELAAPGRPSQRLRRTLVDRVPPALRASGKVTAAALLPLVRDAAGLPVAPGQVHQVMISTGVPDLLGYAESVASLAARLAPLPVDTASTAGRAADGGVLGDLAVGNRLWPLLSAGLLVPALGDRPGLRPIVAAPRIFVATLGVLAADGGCSLRTDVVRQDVAFALQDGSAAGPASERMLWHGALEGALEHAWIARWLVRSGGRDASIASASAQVDGAPLVRLPPADADRLQGRIADADVAARLRRSLAAGNTVLVAPATLASTGGADSAAYWELGGDSLRAVLGDGYGGGFGPIRSGDLKPDKGAGIRYANQNKGGGNEYGTLQKIRSAVQDNAAYFAAGCIVAYIIEGAIIFRQVRGSR